MYSRRWSRVNKWPQILDPASSMELQTQLDSKPIEYKPNSIFNNATGNTIPNNLVVKPGNLSRC